MRERIRSYKYLFLSPERRWSILQRIRHIPRTNLTSKNCKKFLAVFVCAFYFFNIFIFFFNFNKRGSKRRRQCRGLIPQRSVVFVPAGERLLSRFPPSAMRRSTLRGSGNWPPVLHKTRSSPSFRHAQKVFLGVGGDSFVGEIFFYFLFFFEQGEYIFG